MREGHPWGPIHLLRLTVSLGATVAVAWGLWELVDFLVVRAAWTGSDRSACTSESTGACWAFIVAKLPQLAYGFYPEASRWRPNAFFALATILLIPLLLPTMGAKRLNAFAFFILLPAGAFMLLRGGALGLAPVPTQQWGGLTVTVLVALTSISASLPIGLALAFARRSTLPLVHYAAGGFIEFWRGVPLVTVLFFAVYVLPLFLPKGWGIDAFLRVLIGISLFASAYMAEVIRGGLQSITLGQYEAGRALGLSDWRVMHLVVLPQAIRRVVPGIVNTFIMLFKDTTLVIIVSILDLLGQLRAAEADPQWATPVTEITGLAFVGFTYFTFCFGMSAYSRFIEARLAKAR